MKDDGISKENRNIFFDSGILEVKVFVQPKILDSFVRLSKANFINEFTIFKVPSVGAL